MAGQGPAADAEGNLYLMTGNGSFDSNGSKLGTSIIKLSPTLQLATWFSPHNNQSLGQGNNDQDLGSAGALLLPGTQLAVGGGKSARLYVVNTTNMGGFNSQNDNQIVQEFSVSSSGSDTHHIHGSPVYWEGPAGKHLYVWTENAFLKAYKFGGTFQTSPDLVSTTQEPESVPGGSQGMPGGILSISAKGGNAGSGVLWASHPYRGDANQEIVPGVLRAYNASDLASELWNSEKNPARDSVGNFAKFTAPTIANGRVYMASMGGLQNKTILPETAQGGPALADLKRPIASYRLDRYG